MSLTVLETCCNCGVEFAMTRELADHRRRDHKIFYCPNGHPQHYTGKSENEKEIERKDRWIKRLEEMNRESYAQREDLVGFVKECPIPGCDYRSKRQVPRDPVAMGRGLERVRRDILEHLVRDHSSRVEPEPLALPAGSDD